MLVKAHAKLNLCLEVLGQRPDGYHEVSTLIQAIDLEDDLRIVQSSTLRVICSSLEIEEDENLVWRAATALAASCGRRPSVEITLEKRIPVGMGLGGGSSDAAAALLALNDLWGLGLSLERLVEIGSSLGSDVPYFFWGGSALATGRGNIIEPVPTRPGVPVTLVVPEGTVRNKTAWMYGNLGPSSFSDGGLTRCCLQNLMAAQWTDDLFYNAFEAVALRKFPGLGEIFDEVTVACGRRPHLTGAGPAMFLLPSSVREHALVAQALQPQRAQAYFVRTLGRFERKSTSPGVPNSQSGYHSLPLERNI